MSEGSGHWLGAELAELAVDPGARAEAAREERQAFLGRLDELVVAAAGRPGVRAAFVAFDGMLVASAGRADFDAVASLAQRLLVPAADAWAARALGRIHQLLVVGEREKLALVQVGPVVLGLLSPVGVRLADATA